MIKTTKNLVVGESHNDKLIEPNEVLSRIEIFGLKFLIYFHNIFRGHIFLISPIFVIILHIQFIQGGLSFAAAIASSIASLVVLIVAVSKILSKKFKHFDDIYFLRTKLKPEVYFNAYVQSYEDIATRIFSDPNYFFTTAREMEIEIMKWVRRRIELKLSYEQNYYVAQDFGLKISFLVGVPKKRPTHKKNKFIP